MEKIQGFNLFDAETMSAFCDGTEYDIDGVHYNTDVNENEDPDAEYPEELIRKFAAAVKSFESPHQLELVYVDDFKYYLVALLGHKEDDFEWSEEFEALHEKLQKHLKDNNIDFG